MQYSAATSYARRLLMVYRVEFALSCLSFLASLAVLVGTKLRFPNDDQFITFRYIDNLAAGHGFVYNLGEYVLGTTTPLFTLLGTLVRVLVPWGDTPTLIGALNSVLIAASVFVWVRIARSLVPMQLAATGGVLLALLMSRLVPEGMETPLFVLTSLLAVLFFLRGSLSASAVFLSLAVLTRPDAGIIAVVIFLFVWRYHTLRAAIHYAGVSVLVALPWSIFALAYFGSVIPQSLYAKLHGHSIYSIPDIQALKVQLSSLSRILWGRIFDPDYIPAQVFVNLLPTIGLVAVGVVRTYGRESIIAVIPIAYLVLYSISNPVLFPWYWSQMEPFWALLIIVGAGWVWERFHSTAAKAAILCVLLAGPLFLWTTLLFTESAGTKTSLFDAGRYIAERMEEGDRVGLSNIGIVGYISKAHIVDFIGLVSPSSVTYYPILSDCRREGELYVVPPALVRDQEPDWLVAGYGEVTSCLLNEVWFEQGYEKVEDFEGTVIWKKRQ